MDAEIAQEPFLTSSRSYSTSPADSHAHVQGIARSRLQQPSRHARAEGSWGNKREAGVTCLPLLPPVGVIRMTQSEDEVGKEGSRYPATTSSDHPEGGQALLGITAERRRLVISGCPDRKVRGGVCVKMTVKSKIIRKQTSTLQPDPLSE